VVHLTDGDLAVIAVVTSISPGLNTMKSRRRVDYEKAQKVVLGRGLTIDVL